MALKLKLSGTNFSLENANVSTECSSRQITIAPMMTGAFSWDVSKLFSELKLVPDSPFFIYAEAYWEAIER